MKVTARKVAQDLGVSTATVSLAINGRPGVNYETRKKILEYIKLLQADYETTEMDGKSLKMLIYIQEDTRYRNAMKDFSQNDCAQICRMLQEYGMNLKLCYAYTVKELENILLESETDGTVGILLSFDEAPDNILDDVPESKVPIIMYDSPLPSGRNDCDVINLHDTQGIQIAMNYLRKCGHTNIVYFSNSETVYNFEMRRKAFRLYMEEWRGGLPEGSLYEVGKFNETRESDIEKYFKSIQKKPDAILAENFSVSLAIMRVLKKMSISVPDEISIMGIDDPNFYEYSDVDFTCIEVPIYERHAIMMKHMIGRLNEKEHYPQEISLGMKLKIGKTVRDNSNLKSIKSV